MFIYLPLPLPVTLCEQVGTSCEDIQALDESMGHLKMSVEGIAETTEMRSTQVFY